MGISKSGGLKNYTWVREHNIGANLLQNKHLDLDRPKLPITAQPRGNNKLFWFDYENCALVLLSCFPAQFFRSLNAHCGWNKNLVQQLLDILVC